MIETEINKCSVQLLGLIKCLSRATRPGTHYYISKLAVLELYSKETQLLNFVMVLARIEGLGYLVKNYIRIVIFFNMLINL